MLLKDKKILVGVTGSIAIYKSLDLIRLYIKAGAKVRVIMTEGAKKFISPLTFEAISQSKVLDETSENWDKNQDYNHIDIGKWSDIFVIAPSSANTINKLSNGLADNLLLQTALAYSKVKLLAPAANTMMLKNPITQDSLEKLKLYNFKIVSSVTKELVCKDVGDGAMAEPLDIFNATVRELLKHDYWLNRRVVLSGGGTVEKIDEVRYISNFSSGKMAASMAKALYFKGADVCLVSTRGYDDIPKDVELISVQSSKQMYENLNKCLDKTFDKKAFLFMVAAVSDYIPSSPKSGKMKKNIIGENWNLELTENIDILSTLNKENLITIGFKAEMDKKNAKHAASTMLEKKNLDAVCLNVLNNSESFGSNDNEIELILKEKSYEFKGNKLDVSLDIVTALEKEFEKYD